MSLSFPLSGIPIESLLKIAGFDQAVAEDLDDVLDDIGAGGLVSDVPFVDLRQSPYSVQGGSTSLAVRQQNTAGIMAALAEYSGTGAMLALPIGTTYVEEDLTPEAPYRRHCLRFFTGDSDITFVGQGMYASKLSMYAVSDGGDFHLLVIDGASRIEIAHMTLELNTIENIEVTQQNHMLCVFNNQGGGTTEDIRVHHVQFTTCNGDQARILADNPADTVSNIEFSHCIFRGHGTVTSIPANDRIGARCCVAIQRGGEDVTFVDCYFEGARNSLWDEEPSGSASRRIKAIRCIFDNSRGITDNSVSLGGSGGGDIAYDGAFIDCYIYGGCISMLGGTSGFSLIRCTIEQNAASPFDATQPLIFTRSGSAGHENLRIIDCTFRRGGTSGAGLMVDVINSASGTTIRGCRFEQAAEANIIKIEAVGVVQVRNCFIDYTAANAASRTAITIDPLASGGTIGLLEIDDVTLSTASGKFAYVANLASRASRNISKVKIRDIHAGGTATRGVYWTATAGTFDLTPEITGVDADIPWEQRTNADAVTTDYYVMLSGNRNDVAQYVGDATPEGALTAKQGSTCVVRAADSSALYFKTTGTGNTGWAALS